MKKVIQLFVSLNLILLILSFSTKQNKSFNFSYCESESGRCAQKCTVVLTSGSELKMGSYIKVYMDKELITEGYILKHVRGSIYILKDKSDAKNPEVCGGCCGDALSIDISKKQIWGC